MVNKVRKLDSGKVAQPQQEHIVGVTTKAGEEIGFDRRAALSIRTRSPQSQQAP